MKNAILILVNNLNYFKLFVDNYPNELIKNNVRLIVVNETRIGNKTKEIGDILSNSKIEFFTIFDSKDICEVFKDHVVSNDFVDDYTMGMNILSLWFIKKCTKINKILLLDDDVILRDGVMKVFDFDNHAFKSNRLSAGAAIFDEQSENAKEIFREWFRIFDIDFSQDWWINEYLKKYANSGQRLIILDKLDLNRYEEKLKAFFESDIFYWAWLARNKHTSWYFDERFETFYFFDELNDNLKDLIFLVLSRREKLTNGSIKKMLKSIIIHNATNSHKRNVYNFMIENNVIKGEQLDD